MPFNPFQHTHFSAFAEDIRHLRYELNSRCLDETLPPIYLNDIRLLVSDLQHAFNTVARAQLPQHI